MFRNLARARYTVVITIAISHTGALSLSITLPIVIARGIDRTQGDSNDFHRLKEPQSDKRTSGRNSRPASISTYTRVLYIKDEKISVSLS